MSVRASPLDQHGLQWDEKFVIATRLCSVVSPGYSSAVALLIYLVCPRVCALIECSLVLSMLFKIISLISLFFFILCCVCVGPWVVWVLGRGGWSGWVHGCLGGWEVGKHPCPKHHAVCPVAQPPKRPSSRQSTQALNQTPNPPTTQTPNHPTTRSRADSGQSCGLGLVL